VSSYGTGSITFERGRYRLRVPDGKGGHRGAGTFATWDEADAVRAALLLEGGAVPIGATILFTYGERVIERWVRAGLRDKKSTRSRWSVIVGRAPFAHAAIATLPRAEIRDWLRSLPAELGARGVPLSWQSQKHAFGLLCRVLDEAIEDGLIKVNPARGLKLQRRQERAEGWTWLTIAELAAVFALELTAEQRVRELVQPDHQQLLVRARRGSRDGDLGHAVRPVPEAAAQRQRRHAPARELGGRRGGPDQCRALRSATRQRTELRFPARDLGQHQRLALERAAAQRQQHQRCEQRGARGRGVRGTEPLGHLGPPPRDSHSGWIQRRRAWVNALQAAAPAIPFGRPRLPRWRSALATPCLLSPAAAAILASDQSGCRMRSARARSLGVFGFTRAR